MRRLLATALRIRGGSDDHPRQAYANWHNMTAKKRIGTVIKRLREARRLTQQELAKKARVSQAHLSRLETGERADPGISILKRLAKALGVPVTALLE